MGMRPLACHKYSIGERSAGQRQPWVVRSKQHGSSLKHDLRLFPFAFIRYRRTVLRRHMILSAVIKQRRRRYTVVADPLSATILQYPTQSLDQVLLSTLHLIVPTTLWTYFLGPGKVYRKNAG